LYRRHYSGLLAFAQRLTFGDRLRAEDIVQETMVRAWRNLDALHAGRDQGRPWLFTVARRIAIDWMRSRAVRPAEVSGDLLATQASVDDEMNRTLLALDLEHAMTTLSSDHRAVLVNIYLRGRTLNETARRLGVPVGTVKSRTHNALRALRKTIGAGGE
jgi:RNA polymerase sigma-70 factor (ECF subfamily)